MGKLKPKGNELQVRNMNIAVCDDEQAIREQINELIVKEKPGVCPELYETGDGQWPVSI